jgi:FkbM family methyltransferase
MVPMDGIIRAQFAALRTTSQSPWAKFEKTITVSSYRLDDWCAENGVKQVHFIWMDVQGAEGDVITGPKKLCKERGFCIPNTAITNFTRGSFR